jgi:hypothetical protein
MAQFGVTRSFWLSAEAQDSSALTRKLCPFGRKTGRERDLNRLLVNGPQDDEFILDKIAFQK